MTSRRFLFIALANCLVGWCLCSDDRPNIILLLTDDQDALLGGGTDHMPFVRELLQGHGATFDYGYVHTPVCCPSRSSILSGRYLHNGGALNNTREGNCYGDAWRNDIEPYHTFAVHAQEAGYQTSYAGKYLNMYGIQDPDRAQVPPGWDKWLGLVGNSIYYNYKIVQSDDNGGTAKTRQHGDEYKTDYLPDVVANRSLAMIEEFLSVPNQEERKPFLLVNAWPTPHDPFTPSPQWNNTMENIHAPRTPNYNTSVADKSWLVRIQEPLTKEHEEWIDAMYHHRIEALQSVDAHVAKMVDLLERKGALNNTYIIYTSDNGFQYGQHRLRFDKRMLYEHDLRVPFILRGPAVPKGVVMGKDCAVLNVDIAPTILDIVHGTTETGPADEMDGSSMLKCFASAERRTKPRIASPPPRKDFLVSYFGEYNPACGMYSCKKTPPLGTVPIDCKNNTYSCLRTLDHDDDSIYCTFAYEEGFGEYYDMLHDPWQLSNQFFNLSTATHRRYNMRLETLLGCQGPSCRASANVNVNVNAVEQPAMFEIK